MDAQYSLDNFLCLKNQNTYDQYFVDVQQQSLALANLLLSDVSQITFICLSLMASLAQMTFFDLTNIVRTFNTRETHLSVDIERVFGVFGIANPQSPHWSIRMPAPPGPVSDYLGKPISNLDISLRNTIITASQLAKADLVALSKNDKNGFEKIVHNKILAYIHKHGKAAFRKTLKDVKVGIVGELNRLVDAISAMETEARAFLAEYMYTGKRFTNLKRKFFKKFERLLDQLAREETSFMQQITDGFNKYHEAFNVQVVSKLKEKMANLKKHPC